MHIFEVFGLDGLQQIVNKLEGVVEVLSGKVLGICFYLGLFVVSKSVVDAVFNGMNFVFDRLHKLLPIEDIFVYLL